MASLSTWTVRDTVSAVCHQSFQHHFPASVCQPRYYSLQAKNFRERQIGRSTKGGCSVITKDKLKIKAKTILFLFIHMSIIINTVCDENNDYLLKEKYRLNMALFTCGYSCKTQLS